MRLIFAFCVALATVGAVAQLNWVGNTNLFLYGQGFPKRAGFIEEGGTITVTTETNPIAGGQSVVAVVTTDNFATTQEIPFVWDYNTGSNSHWYALLGPFASGKEVKFYIRANGSGGSVAYDSNGGANFGFYARWTPRFRNGTILQWFQTDYRTIMKRLPEVARAGYSAIYLPPPSKGASGTFTTGYNPFDRFDLGDRPWQGTVRTFYGTSQDLHELIMMAHRFDIEVYADLVYNHNANRANAYINLYPDMLPEDFHIRSSSDTGNWEVDFNAGAFSFSVLNHDLIGLVDIAQEDGNNTQTGTFTLPSFATWNPGGKPSYFRHPRTRHYYPGNTPVTEDVRELLKRWGWYLTNLYGFDGYRLDAVKHTPPGFFDFVADSNQPGSYVGNGDALPNLYNLKRSLYIFAEDYTGDSWEMREYAKTGMNLLDFPLKFQIDNVFNSSGFGNLGNTFSNGWALDSATGLPYEYGGLSRDGSVAFVQSHDQGPPWSNNLAYAMIMGRPARPLVYFDGNNLDSNNYNQFPKPGRTDALGSFGDTILKQLEARNRGGRGYVVNRWVEQSLYVYERQVNGSGVMLVGLNLRGDTDQTRTVNTAFASGTVLRDVSGQKPNVTVTANGQVTITVPSNSAPGNTNNARGYVFYLPVAPTNTVADRPIQFYNIYNESSVLGTEISPTTYPLPAGPYASPQSFAAVTVTGDRVHLLSRTSADTASAFVKLDNGLGFGGRVPASNTPEGLTDGYVPMVRNSSGLFELRDFSTVGLPDGLHILRLRLFRDTGTRPGVYQDYCSFFYLKRATSIVLDGDLTDMGSPVVSQARTPSSNNNRVDQMYVANDDLYLYVGLAGQVDTAEGLTNGIATLFDTDPAGTQGVRSLAALEDDSSPAARLLSNGKVVAKTPVDFGMGVMRQTWRGSMPGESTPGQPTMTQTVGAFAGLYKLAGDPRLLTPRNLAVAWQPRPGPFDTPVRGLEAAIPLRDLYTSAPPSTIGVVSYLLTTGERTTPLASSNTARATYGGYGVPVSWVSNQILPVQSAITTDPGENLVNLYTLAYAPLSFMTQETTNVKVNTTALIFDAANNVYRQRVTITNRTASPMAGGIAVRVSLPAGVTLVNKTADTLTAPNQPYFMITRSGLAGGQAVWGVLEYAAPSSAFSPVYTVWRGRGVL